MRVTRATVSTRDRSAPAPLPFRKPAEPPTATAGAADPAPSKTPPPRAWNDAALRIKVTLLVLLAAVGGVIVGMIESRLGHLMWPLVVGFALLSLALLHLASRWAWGPLEQLIHRVEAADTHDRPAVLASLAVHREDEVGKLARVLHQVSLDAARHEGEARRLRRTIDDRIARATKLATHNLKEMAMRDPLTDLGNRRFLDEHLPPLFESCAQAETDLVAVAIDVDNFKTLNDTLGHAAGDQLLRALGSIIRATIRHEDYAVRLGGDEFVILMPACPLVRVRELSEQLLGLFRQHARVTVRGEVKPGLTLGVASLLRDRVETPQDLLRRADENLYEAKRAGKGRLNGA